MATTTLRSRLPAALVAAWLVLTTGGPAVGQEKKADAGTPEARPDAPTPWIFGQRYCAQCHAHPENSAAESVICRMNESQTWERLDKHKNAFALLSDPRGKRMGEILGIDVTSDVSCLNCHSIPGPPAPSGPGSRAAAPIRTQQFDRAGDGVSCVVCHGTFREWVFEHTAYEDPSWRTLTRKEKERRYGMVDLWDPVTRTRKCLSCHIGNADEAKVLTHAMYAAGHPPLPGIEVATFSQAMPNHWELLREKRAGRKPEVRQALERTLDLDKLEQTELVAIGGLLALGESLRLFATQAGTDAADVPGTRRPDFARFDCYACHHDVNRPSWRQAQSFAGAPGRPPAPTWPSALVALGIEAAAPERSAEREVRFQRGLGELHAALAAQPFGNRDRSIAAARSLAAWTDETLADVSRVKFARPVALRLLRRICRVDGKQIPDYDTARQLFWAFQAIHQELEPAAKPESPIARTLARMDRDLGFSLPTAGLQVPIEQTLAARLRAVNDFNPAPFVAGLAELAGQLPAR